MYSARPPSVISPMIASRSHRCTWCRRQKGHSPQWISVSTATRSPTCRSVTSRPSPHHGAHELMADHHRAHARPVIGLGRSAGGMNSGPCVYSSRSVPQIPHQEIASRTSSGAGASGSGNSSMRISSSRVPDCGFHRSPPSRPQQAGVRPNDDTMQSPGIMTSGRAALPVAAERRTKSRRIGRYFRRPCPSASARPRPARFAATSSAASSGLILP